MPGAKKRLEEQICLPFPHIYHGCFFLHIFWVQALEQINCYLKHSAFTPAILKTTDVVVASLIDEVT